MALPILNPQIPERVEIYILCELCKKGSCLIMSAAEYRDWQNDLIPIGHIVPGKTDNYYARVLFGHCLNCKEE